MIDESDLANLLDAEYRYLSSLTDEQAKKIEWFHQKYDLVSLYSLISSFRNVLDYYEAIEEETKEVNK